MFLVGERIREPMDYYNEWEPFAARFLTVVEGIVKENA